MNRRCPTKNRRMRAIAVILTVALFSLEISCAYPGDFTARTSSLAAPSALQAHNLSIREALVTTSVARYLFGDKAAGVEAGPLKYLAPTLTSELGSSAEGFDLYRVKFEDGIASIPYKAGERNIVFEVARRDNPALNGAAGGEWIESENYFIRRVPISGAAESPKGFRLIHSGTRSDPIRVVLIMPRSTLQKAKPTRFPIGIMSIASCLSNKDFLFKLAKEIPALGYSGIDQIPDIDVKIIDLQAEQEDFDLDARLKALDPDVVGISAVTQLFSSAGMVSRTAAKAVPRAIRVIGGVHISAISERRATDEFERAMIDEGFQIAVIREGEEALSEVMLRLARYMEIRDVPGLVLMEGSGESAELYRTADRREVKRRLSLDDYPLAAHSLNLINTGGYDVMVDIYGKNRGVAGSLITSRGCPYQCIFCASKAVFSRRVEHVSARMVFEEFKYYHDRGSTGFYIMDDNFCLDKEKIFALADLMESSGMDVTFSAFAHANSITPEVARALKRSGCRVVALGVESGDGDLLKRVGKNTSIGRIGEATRALQGEGIYVKYFLLTGLPGQDWPSIKKTAQLIIKERPNAIDVAVATPYPGSALYGSDGVKVVHGVAHERLVHIVEPQLKSTETVEVLTYTDVMTSEEIARSRDLLNELFRHLDDKAVVDSVMSEIEGRIRESGLNGYEETHIVKARRAAREAKIMKSSKYGLDLATAKMHECFGFIRKAIGEAIAAIQAPAGPLRLEDVEVTAKAPVRLDIGSGRGSDLFVVSMERGGKVLNAAITLNDEKPITVSVKAIPEHEIRIYSADMNTTKVITDIGDFDISDTSVSNDPLRLYKAALIEAGIVPDSLRGDLKEILRELGGGLEISGKVSDIPPGSGLGISSILAITLLRALYEVTGRTPSEGELIMKTVSLEQRLGSYGGWQDPVGGAFGGIKWITADPGNPVPHFKAVKLSPDTISELESRIVLYYTGKQHFAGDILGQIITGYLLREEPGYTAMLEAISIRDKMLAALEADDIDRFGALAADYWKATVKQVGPEASNDTIDRVLAETADLIVGGKASGAGGGGFFFLVAKRGKTKALMERLELISKKTAGKIYRFRFDPDGITIHKKKNIKKEPTVFRAPAIEVSDDGVFSRGEIGLLREAVTGFFRMIESSPDHKPLNFLYRDRVEEVDIGDGLFCDLVLNAGREDYVKKTALTPDVKVRAPAAKPDVMIGHMTPPGRSRCFFCNVKESSIIARLRFRGADYVLIPNDNPYGPESMLLAPIEARPQRLDGEFMTLFAGFVKALGEEYEGMYNEPFASSSIYHRHGQIRRGRSSIMRNEEGSLGLNLLREVGSTRIFELKRWPSTALLFESDSALELGEVFGKALEAFHGRNVSSNVNIRSEAGRIRAIQYPRIAGRERYAEFCPEHPQSYGNIGSLEMGGWIIFVGEGGFNFMADLYKRNVTEFRTRVRALLGEASLKRETASDIVRRALPSRELGQDEGRFGPESAVASIMVLAREARRHGQKLIIGLETDWIPGFGAKGSLQRNAITTLTSEIDDIDRRLKSIGLDNVVLIHRPAGELADALIAEADSTGTSLDNMVVMASTGTIYSDSFARLREADPEERPFLAGIDPADLIRYYEQFGEASDRQLYIRLAQMLYITLEIAAGKEPPQLPMIASYDRAMRTVIFLPRAEPVDYELLKSTYKSETLALEAA